jgi:hypothetical protein
VTKTNKQTITKSHNPSHTHPTHTHKQPLRSNKNGKSPEAY